MNTTTHAFKKKMGVSAPLSPRRRGECASPVMLRRGTTWKGYATKTAQPRKIMLHELRDILV